MAALVLLALAPALVILLTLVTTHIVLYRYLLWCLPGLAILSAAMLCRFASKDVVVGVAVLATLVVGLTAREAAAVRRWTFLRESEAMLAALSNVREDAGPIVVPDLHAFMELSRYAPASLRGQLVYPICADLDLRYRGYDTDPLIMSGLSHWTTVSAECVKRRWTPGVTSWSR